MAWGDVVWVLRDGRPEKVVSVGDGLGLFEGGVAAVQIGETFPTRKAAVKSVLDEKKAARRALDAEIDALEAEAK